METVLQLCQFICLVAFKCIQANEYFIFRLDSLTATYTAKNIPQFSYVSLATKASNSTKCMLLAKNIPVRTHTTALWLALELKNLNSGFYGLKVSL